jgi:hypothetical protein
MGLLEGGSSGCEAPVVDIERAVEESAAKKIKASGCSLPKVCLHELLFNCSYLFELKLSYIA